MVGIIKKELLKNLKDKGNYFYLIGMPIIFIIIFAAVFSNAEDQKPSIHYYDMDQSQASKQFVEEITSINGFTFVKEVSKKKAIEKVKNGDITHVVIIPKSFGENLSSAKPNNLDMFYDPTQANSLGVVQTFLKGLETSMQESKLKDIIMKVNPELAKSPQVNEPIFKIKEQSVNTNKIDAVTLIVPGYIVMFAFYIILCMAKVFLDDFNKGMLARIKSTPQKKYTYVIGMWVPQFIMVLLQASVLLSFGYFVYDITIQSFLPFSILVFGLAFLATSIGLMFIFLAKNEKTIMSLTQVFVLGGAALGGLWFPIDMFPSFMKKLTNFVPQYWIQKGFVSSMTKTVSFMDLLTPYLVTFGTGILCLIIALLAYPKYIKQAKS